MGRICLLDVITGLGSSHTECSLYHFFPYMLRLLSQNEYNNTLFGLDNRPQVIASSRCRYLHQIISLAQLSARKKPYSPPVAFLHDRYQIWLFVRMVT